MLDDSQRAVVHLANELASALRGYGSPIPTSSVLESWGFTDAYDSRIHDPDLRSATRSRFLSQHYADAVEAGVKALNECIRNKAGVTEDGDALMTSVFSVAHPKLRINRLRTDSDRTEQRGHMLMCQAVVAAWRNPRAHSSQFEDTPEGALRMLEHVQHLLDVTKAAVRTRRRRNPP